MRRFSKRAVGRADRRLQPRCIGGKREANWSDAVRELCGRPSIPSDRQYPNAVTKGVHGNESAGFEVWFSGLDCPDHDIANRGR